MRRFRVAQVRPSALKNPREEMALAWAEAETTHTCGNAAPTDCHRLGSRPPRAITRRLNLPKLPAKPSILGAAPSTSELDLEPPAPSEKAGVRGGGWGAAHSLAPRLRLPTPHPQHALPARVPSQPRTLLSLPTRLRCSCSAKHWSACLPGCPLAPTTSRRSGSRC